MTSSIRHIEFEPYQNSPQAKKSCSSPQQMMNTSWGPLLRRHLCCTATTSKHKAKSTTEQGNTCGQSTITCPHPSKVQISIGSNAFQDPLHGPLSGNAFQDHLHSSIHHKLFQDHRHQNHLFPGLQMEILVLQDHQCLQDHHFCTT